MLNYSAGADFSSPQLTNACRYEPIMPIVPIAQMNPQPSLDLTASPGQQSTSTLAPKPQSTIPPPRHVNSPTPTSSSANTPNAVTDNGTDMPQKSRRKDPRVQPASSKASSPDDHDRRGKDCDSRNEYPQRSPPTILATRRSPPEDDILANVSNRHSSPDGDRRGKKRKADSLQPVDDMEKRKEQQEQRQKEVERKRKRLRDLHQMAQSRLDEVDAKVRCPARCRIPMSLTKSF